jgi:polyisoprenoid-binding protein YceI
MKLTTNVFVILFTVLTFMACKNDKAVDAVVGEAQEAATSITGTSYNVDTAVSKVIWTGSKPTGSHTGTVDVSSGSLTVKDGNITAGNFVLDMTTISSTDLEGDMKAGLEAHLKGQRKPEEVDDFFNIVKFPTATFEITKVTQLVNDPEATHLVYGNLTIKETTKEIGIKANVGIQDGTIMVKTPEFSINRTEWGIKFMSKNFFDDLKDNFINDDIQMSINLTAKS